MQPPKLICCGDYSSSLNVVGEVCADAQQQFGLVQVPTVMGDPEKGVDVFISPRRIKDSAIRIMRTGDNAHNAIKVKVPMLLPCRRYLRDVVKSRGLPRLWALDGRTRARRRVGSATAPTWMCPRPHHQSRPRRPAAHR